MKRIEAIIRPGKVNDVCGALDKVGHPGVMVSEIEGHGKQKGLEQQVRGKTYKVDLLPKARLEVVVKDSDVEKTVTAIREAAYSGNVGDGKIFIYPVDDTVRIRTAEHGDIAI